MHQSPRRKSGHAVSPLAAVSLRAVGGEGRGTRSPLLERLLLVRSLLEQALAWKSGVRAARADC